MVAGLPSKRATSRNARFCTVTVALGDVMKKIFSFNTIYCRRLLSAGFLLRCKSLVMPLKKTKLKLWAEWICTALGMLALLLAAEVASAAPWDVKNNAPPFIRRDLTASSCELCGYGHIKITISNPYDRVDRTDMTVVETLGGSGLTFDPTAPTSVIYRVNNANGSILTWKATQIPDLGRLKDLPGNNQSNTINVLAAHKVVLQGGSPFLLASYNFVDFTVTSEFASCTSTCPWGDTYER
jgi:hypothetical protein